MAHGNQQNIHDGEDGEAFGDKLTRKSDNILRLMLHNVNRLPLSRSADKSKKLISSISNKQLDLALITKVGLCWRLVKTNDQWHERMRESFQAARSELAFNKTEPDLTELVQFGGVGIMAVDDVSHRVVGQGQDATGLGRWA
jgi:hypothetical protein